MKQFSKKLIHIANTKPLLDKGFKTVSYPLNNELFSFWCGKNEKPENDRPSLSIKQSVIMDNKYLF